MDVFICAHYILNNSAKLNFPNIKLDPYDLWCPPYR